MTDFREVADRVWVARYAWLHCTITAIRGERGVVLVDTFGSERAARGMLGDLRRAGVGPVVAVVNTHEHWDHVLGNAVLRDAYGAALPIHATAWAADHTEAACRRAAATLDDPEHADDVRASRIVPADHPLTTGSEIDLGDRRVELRHLGRGHTAGDLLVRVPDADVLVAGDLIEESADPWFGADSHPLDWPDTLRAALALIGERTVVVPGHGAPVDRGFVHAQQADLAGVAATLRDLVARGVPLAEALRHDAWPYPRAWLADAVRRGYAALTGPGPESSPSGT